MEGLMDSVVNYPTDIWNLILPNLNDFDAMLFRGACKNIFSMVKQLRPYPKYFVLDQDQCMKYLVQNGYLSCIDYAINALNYESNIPFYTCAASNGHVETIKFLREKGCHFDPKIALLECSGGTCDLAMTKYLLETCISWNKMSIRDKTIIVENMASHGHIECLKYVMQQDGETPKKFTYTSTIECLDFAIENNFDWSGESGAREYAEAKKMLTLSAVAMMSRPPRLVICEEAAQRGNLTILKYAHEKGVPLKNSAYLAAKEGHVDCLKYSIEHADNAELSVPKDIKNIQCFKYLLEKYGIGEISQNFKMSYALSDNSGEYLRFAVNSGVPLPSPAIALLLLQTAGKSSVENFKFILERTGVKRAHFDLLVVLQYFSYENMQILWDRNIVNFNDDYEDQEIEKAYKLAILSKDVRMFKFVWGLVKKIHLAPKNEAETSGTPEILEFMIQKGVKWPAKSLVAENLPNFAFLLRTYKYQWLPFKNVLYRLNRVCFKYATYRIKAEQI